MKLKTILSVISITIFATGCQHMGPSQGSGGRSATAHLPEPKPVQASRSKRITAALPEAPDAAPPDDLWQVLRDGMHWEHVDNPRIDRARQGFLAQPTYLKVISERSRLYLYYIVESVQDRGLPLEIALLPLVESTMDPFARSAGHAAGLWQIMPATGRHLGLGNSWWYDGRMDVRTSTQAALNYLESLHETFDGDWLLALAAYNSGEGRVRRAVNRNRKSGKPTDFWSLSLPRETRDYVPRLLALTDIISEPERYQATLPPVPNRPAFAVADVGGQIDIARAAELADIDESELRALNPGQLQWATAPNQPAELLVPSDSLADFEARLANLPAQDRIQWRHYRIQRGDSLGRIARKFQTSVAQLKETNQLHSNLIRTGDTLLIPQGKNTNKGLLLAGGEPRETRKYRVKSGDSLYRIARRFQVTIEDIVSWNSLNPRAYLRPGQRLTLYIKGS